MSECPPGRRAFLFQTHCSSV